MLHYIYIVNEFLQIAWEFILEIGLFSEIFYSFSLVKVDGQACEDLRVNRYCLFPYAFYRRQLFGFIIAKMEIIILVHPKDQKYLPSSENHDDASSLAEFFKYYIQISISKR